MSGTIPITIPADTGTVNPRDEGAMRRFLSQEMQRLSLNLDIHEPNLESIAPLGAGSSGTITLERDIALGRNVAVKTLHEHLRARSDQIERMIREAQTAAQLEHPNIVPIYRLGVSARRGVYFTMRRLRGDSLRRVIDELALRNPAYTWVYSLSRRIATFLKICYGVAYAHSKNVLHRDLKPENIRIGNYGEVTIIDWGLVHEVNAMNGPAHAPQPEPPSTVTQDSDSFNPLQPSNPTMDGEIAGTPRYMSPEQANAQVSHLDARSDIYSLGVILYELLTCANPFYQQDNNGDVIQAVRTGNFPRPRQLPRGKNIPVELEAICLKALAYDPRQRYQSVQALIQDIYAYQESRFVTAYKAPPLHAALLYLHRHAIFAAILFGLLFSAACTLLLTRLLQPSLEIIP